MTPKEAIYWADRIAGLGRDTVAALAVATLAAEVRRLQSEVDSLAFQNKYLAGSRSNVEVVAENTRLQSENTALRLYAPARRAQPTVKTPPIAPTNWQFWTNETDEEFAERAGRKVTEVAR